jgi:hypothetical protein
MKNEKEKKPAGPLPNAVATIDAIPFLEGLVRYLAERRCQISHTIEATHPGWQKIDTSSVETFVSGNFTLKDEKNTIRTPFTGCFVFTCTRGEEGSYELMWSNSLS